MNNIHIRPIGINHGSCRAVCGLVDQFMDIEPWCIGPGYKS